MKQTRVISWISRGVPAAVTRHKVWAGIAVVLLFLAVVIFVPRLPLVGPRSGREAESDFRGHLLQALAGLVLAAGAYFTGRTFALNREGQITERFTRSVEQLAEKKLEIRLGGIYALERIAHDSETHYEPVMEVLTAYLREHARWERTTEPPSIAGRLMWPELPVDYQAVATVLGRRDRRHERPDYALDLYSVDLQNVSLPRANFERARLSFANLENAALDQAHLEQADLARARLGAARLAGADLAGAHLGGANLEGAGLSEANLAGASLGGAELAGAQLDGANLEGAYAGSANLEGANLVEANLRGLHLVEARLERAFLTGAHLEGADLRGASGLTQEQLDEAITDDDTKLPEYLSREAGE
jgi:uncharacterized protein YjbI with pentapeptide repeats